ncbi:MAG: YggS family pyridoxal phosphate-dependent enzyme [Flavobacteriales bacterium]|nr:YggS family pyridoxal phosphate-dependent enzyme [Flavobacteriales bacterium]MEB2342443.1 YggS family pyridoxal phosphate-dependent enzyme [Flavobacteriia bacterium]
MEDGEILVNLGKVEQRIQTACTRAGRRRDEVKLLLATKTVPAERIMVALRAGYTLLGENKVQEVKEKYEALSALPHRMHFIGHLQTNKIKDVLKYGVSCVESVDRLELAEKLHHRLSTENRDLDILIQVNTSAESSKFGVEPAHALELVKAVSAFPTLHIRGLMTIGLFSAQADQVRPCFRLLKQVRQEVDALGLPNVAMHELSMGMSGDLETAIEEGATIVRVGTAVFGKRVHPDSYYWPEAQGAQA